MKKANKKILNFLHFLTKNQKFMNSLEASEKFSANGKKITDRTVRRWFDALKKDKQLDYYLSSKTENFGLVYVSIFIYGLKNLNLIDIIPFKKYIETGKDMSTFENAHLVFYSIPNEYFKDFILFWDTAVKNKLIDSYQYFINKSPTAIYAPLHDVLNSDFTIKNELKDIDNSYFLSLLKKNLEDSRKIEISKRIYENPLIIPIIKEAAREPGLSSNKIWFSIKNKLKDDAWNYIRPYRIKRNKLDGRAIQFVRDTIKDLHNDFDAHFQQIRVSYTPIYKNNIVVYFIIKLKDMDKAIEFSDIISKNSITTVICPPLNNDSIFIFYVVTNNHLLSNIMHSVLPKYIDKKYDNKIFWVFFDKSVELQLKTYNRKIDYGLFDPIKCRWNFETKKYMKEISLLKPDDV